jgi:hypothetical protein
MSLRLPSLLTRETLAEAFGFPLPAAFAEIVMLASREATAAGEDVSFFFEEACGFCLAGEEARYQQTPPELFPIGSMGVDGVHYGYVVHAPELRLDEYPMGELCPLDGDGVFHLGRNTAEGIENLISFVLAYSEEDAEESLSAETIRWIELVSRALAIEPRPEKAQRRFKPNGSGQPVEPAIPDGWLHLATSDGIGVLAPASSFEFTNGLTMDHRHTPPTWYMERADEALARGFPATALLYLREGYWHHWGTAGVIQSFLEAMQRTYLALNRSLLAEVVRACARKWSTIQ